MIFSSKQATGTSLVAMNSQYEDLKKQRKHNSVALPDNLISPELASSLIKANKAKGKSVAVNAGSKPFTLYKEFDSQVTEQFRLDEGDTILNDIMPLSRSLPIGRTVLESTRSSDAGVFQQSMSGEIATVFDAVDYDLENTMVPIGQNGFKRSFREAEQLGLEGFDDLMNQQREAVRTHRQGLVSSLLDGHKDKAGNFISEKGVTWKGMRADGRVDQIDLSGVGFGVDFTDPSITGAEAKSGFIAMIKRRYIDNKVMARATYYISNEIYFNFMKDYSSAYKDVSILTVLKRELGGNIVDIKPSSALTGNQVLSIPLESRYFQPVVAMGVSTIALPRVKWNAPLAFEVVSAIGWNVRNDFADAGKAVQYAAG